MDLFRKLGRIPEEGPSFRVETSCSIKRLLEDEELCCLLRLSQRSTELSCTRFDEERSKKSKTIDEQRCGTGFFA